MRNFYLIIVFVVCKLGYAQSQTFELDPTTKDTINQIDQVGKKQGKWIVFGKSKPGGCYSAAQKVEEGKYKDNKKEGIWKEYYCNGNPKNKVTYQLGRADGYAIMYHENGKVSEEGTWKVNKWVGKYKLFYENGNVQQEFNFNTTGKREGPQDYFYEDGTKMITGNWANGKESGTVTEFHPDGSTKKTTNYNNGEADVASIKTFAPKTAKKVEESKGVAKVVEIKKEETTQDAKVKLPTVLNGYYKLYRKDKQVSKDGDFKNNRLMNGKNYIYNENGILTRIEKYKDGYYIGDEQID